MKDRNCSSLMRCASSLQRLFFLALLSVIAIGAYAQVFFYICKCNNI